MKAFVLLFLLLYSLSARAGESSVAFRDAFRAYLHLRQLEEKLALADRRAVTRQLEAQLTEARIDYQAFLRADSKDLSPWEKAITRNAGKPKLRGPDPIALDFLSLAFGKAAAHWTPADWQFAGEWFGKDVADSFLKITFSMEEVASAPAPAGATRTLLWITDPFTRYLPKGEALREKNKRGKAASALRRSGFTVQEVEVHPFTSPDDQAEELRSELERRLVAGPAVLISTGHASAILLRTFDLNPRLLGNSSIHGWMNVNGKLFGDAPTARAPASVTMPNRQLAEAQRELLPLRGERLERQTPLSPKFRVVNLVSLSGMERPGSSLRDSLMPEGKSFYLRGADALAAIGAALPFAASQQPPTGQRDLASEPSL